MKGRDIKPHIGIFGRRNNGKSSFINAIAKQEIAIVSDVPGTTTDPVKKSMEIEGVGPTIIIDTAGIDDQGDLGKKRVEKSLETLKIIDLAILIITHNTFGDFEKELISSFKSYHIPFFIVHNKSDLMPVSEDLVQNIKINFNALVVDFNSFNHSGFNNIMLLIKKLMPENAYQFTSILGGIVKKGEVVMLITPIDSEAPQGRMILPQVQLLRDVLDNDCVCIVLKETEVETYMKHMLPKPKLVICDSQVFALADKLIPKDIMLTSFSTVLARHKGAFNNYIIGTPKIDSLKDGDKILILESCTHHVSCEDIGRYKIPDWLQNYTGKKLQFEIVAGLSKLPENIENYALLIQCGGCVLTKKQITGRLKQAIDAGVPITNYGMAIAYMHGIFKRAVAPFINEN